MRTSFLDVRAVEGPLNSFFFGQCLTISLLPTECKFCTFDCVYCERADIPGKKYPFSSSDEILSCVKQEFKNAADLALNIDWIMFMGNGEATLHPDFPNLVKSILSLRDEYLPRVRVGVFSNSSTCYRDEIRRTLILLDGCFMKLDAGNMYGFHDINRPLTMFLWGDVIEGLCRLPRVTIQSMFMTGKVDNTDERSVHDWIEAMRCIRPVGVQIFTMNSAPEEQGIFPVDDLTLRKIAERLYKATGISADVYRHGPGLLMYA